MYLFSYLLCSIVLTNHLSNIFRPKFIILEPTSSCFLSAGLNKCFPWILKQLIKVEGGGLWHWLSCTKPELTIEYFKCCFRLALSASGPVCWLEGRSSTQVASCPGEGSQRWGRVWGSQLISWLVMWLLRKKYDNFCAGRVCLQTGWDGWLEAS